MPSLEIAVEYDDGRKEVVRVGRPADLIAFADQFEKLAPDGPYMVREASWLVHRALKIERSFDEWVDELAELEVVRRDAEVEAEAAGVEAAKTDASTGQPDPTPPAAQTGELVEGEWPRLRAGRRVSEMPIASSSHA